MNDVDANFRAGDPFPDGRHVLCCDRRSLEALCTFVAGGQQRPVDANG
jgi:hypothetical protein